MKCFVRLDIYTAEHDRNLRTNCLNNVYGQLRNKNLNSPLKLGSYRFTTCKLDDVDVDMLHCKGRIPIQDYIPRHYGISFGYHYRELVRPSLLGLSFNFTILGQTNITTCFKIPKHDEKLFNCQEYYEYRSLPNFIGDLNTHDVDHWMDSSAASAFLGSISSSDWCVTQLIQNVIQKRNSLCTFAGGIVMKFWKLVWKPPHPFFKN